MKKPPMKRNKFETQAGVAERLGERWVRRRGKKIDREGRRANRQVCAWGSISMCGFL
jgi:hypothetical protein